MATFDSREDVSHLCKDASSLNSHDKEMMAALFGGKDNADDDDQGMVLPKYDQDNEVVNMGSISNSGPRVVEMPDGMESGMEFSNQRQMQPQQMHSQQMQPQQYAEQQYAEQQYAEQQYPQQQMPSQYPNQMQQNFPNNQQNMASGQMQQMGMHQQPSMQQMGMQASQGQMQHMGNQMRGMQMQQPMQQMQQQMPGAGDPIDAKQLKSLGAQELDVPAANFDALLRQNSGNTSENGSDSNDLNLVFNQEESKQDTHNYSNRSAALIPESSREMPNQLQSQYQSYMKEQIGIPTINQNGRGGQTTYQQHHHPHVADQQLEESEGSEEYTEENDDGSNQSFHQQEIPMHNQPFSMNNTMPQHQMPLFPLPPSVTPKVTSSSTDSGKMTSIYVLGICIIVLFFLWIYIKRRKANKT